MLVGVWTSVSQKTASIFSGRDMEGAQRRCWPGLAPAGQRDVQLPMVLIWAKMFTQGHPKWTTSWAAGAHEATGQGLKEGQELDLVTKVGRGV